jgi:hypothetical protein
MANKTYGELYEPAVAAQTPEEAKQHWEKLVQYVIDHNDSILDRTEAEKVVKTNLGYFAGYHDNSTRERVERLYDCAHPVFGKIAQNGPPSPEEAFAAGLRAGEASLHRRAIDAMVRTIWKNPEWTRTDSPADAAVVKLCEAALKAAREILRENEHPVFNRSNPDDIRARGWMVVCTNDYRQTLHHSNGQKEKRVWWSFAKGNLYVKGEAATDAEALDICRAEIDRLEKEGVVRV